MSSDAGDGPLSLETVFSERAKVRSDCGSAKKGGDLGHFTRGQFFSLPMCPVLAGWGGVGWSGVGYGLIQC